jgi:hypothetical protein
LTTIQHGESQYNVDGKIGGDAELSPRGKEYAQLLPKLVRDRIGDKPLTVRRLVVILLYERRRRSGLDLDFAAHSGDRQGPAVYEIDLEGAR